MRHVAVSTSVSIKPEGGAWTEGSLGSVFGNNELRRSIDKGCFGDWLSEMVHPHGGTVRELHPEQVELSGRLGVRVKLPQEAGVDVNE